MDEDSRHLSRRPAKNKPLLKYCQTPGPTTTSVFCASSSASVTSPAITHNANHIHRAAPVTLFSPNDVYLYKQQAPISLAPPSSAPNSMYMASLMSPSGSSLNPFGNYLFVGGAGSPSGQGLTAGHLLGSQIIPRDTTAAATKASSTATRGSSNPYARPISVKDVIAEPGMLGKNSPLVSGIRTTSTSSVSSSNNVASRQYEEKPMSPTIATIQTNSFMRPRSAIVPEKPDQKGLQSKAGMKTSHSEHSVIHVHIDHHRPAEKGIPKPPLGARPQGSRPPSGRKSSLSTPISNGNITITGGSNPAEGSSKVPCSPTLGRANCVQGSPILSRAASSPNGTKHMEGSPNAKLANRIGSASPMANRVSSSPNLSSTKLSVNNSAAGATNMSSTSASRVVPSSPTTNARIANASPIADRRADSSPFKDGKFITNNGTFTTRHLKVTTVTVENAKPVVSSPQRTSSSGTNNQAESPSSSDSRSSSAGSVNNSIRNPHYTPNKPYSEVTQPGHQMGSLAPTATALSSSKQPPTSAQDNNSKVASAKDILTSKPPTPTARRKISPPLAEDMKDGAVKKMPVTGTLTGTIYYRKQSKAEEPIKTTTKQHSSSISRSRSKADGAMSVRKREDSTEEWEDVEENDEEDDDSTVPSERLPGDGEADVRDDKADDDEEDGDGDDDEEQGDDDDDEAVLDDDGEDDDELVDNIYDDEGESDDNSDGYSLQSAGPASRQGSATNVRLKSATKRLLGLTLEHTKSAAATGGGGGRIGSAPLHRPMSSSSAGDLQPALLPSLFPKVPPTVNFVLDGEKVEQLPWEIRKYLKWKMSPITPNVVKNCIARSGFRATKRNHDWIGYWGKHMKAPGFKAIRDYQKVNHFPGSFQIGRKDRLWRNLSKMQVQFGKKEYGFFPQTFVLPFDLKQLKRAWEDGGNKQKWIIKPPASARGIGIKVIHKWNQIPKRRPVIVQRYISRPLLINESKFDIRLYVYVTSYDPLRIYLYDDGLARFASCKYSNSLKSLNNRYMHLTNYSINKKNQEYQTNSDENVCQGHKWGLKALWGYMKKQNINSSAVWESMKDVIIKTIIASEPYVNPLMKANARRRYCCHELFGFDIMLDDTLKPWLIEVNISPSLHSNSPLDINIKGGMIRDLLNIAGFQIPEKNDVRETPSSTTQDIGASNSSSSTNSNNNASPGISMDKRLFCGQLSPDERSKHAYYCQRHADEIIQQTMLDVLTPDDLRMLVETVDEDSRRGNMQRIFPSAHSHRYLRYFEQPRYYNLLLDIWIQKYNRMETRGIAYLEFVCSRGIQLEHPTDDPKHQWSPPNLTIPRDSRATSAPSKGLAPSSVLPKLRKKRIGAGTISSSSLLPSPPHPPASSSRPSPH